MQDPSLGWEWSPGGGHGNALHYSCLENPMDSGAWWVTVHGVAKSQKSEHNGLSVIVLDNFRYRYYLQFIEQRQYQK